MVIEIILAITLLLLFTSFYIIWNLNSKQEMMENWIEDFVQVITKVNEELKEIDYRGSFEADDETGSIFKSIQTIVGQLDRFKGEEQ